MKQIYTIGNHAVDIFINNAKAVNALADLCLEAQVEGVNKLDLLKKVESILAELGYYISLSGRDYSIPVMDGWKLTFYYGKFVNPDDFFGLLEISFRVFRAEMPERFKLENLEIRDAKRLGFSEITTIEKENLEDIVAAIAGGDTQTVSFFPEISEERVFAVLENFEKANRVYRIPVWYESLIPVGTQLYAPAFVRQSNGRYVAFAIEINKTFDGKFDCDCFNGVYYHGVMLKA